MYPWPTIYMSKIKQPYCLRPTLRRAPSNLGSCVSRAPKAARTAPHRTAPDKNTSGPAPRPFFPALLLHAPLLLPSPSPYPRPSKRERRITCLSVHRRLDPRPKIPFPHPFLAPPFWCDHDGGGGGQEPVGRWRRG
jgi:hypothetical protein